jgi:serine/threonine protein kinase
MDANGAAAVESEKAGDTWDVLAVKVQAFLEAWDSRAEPPDPVEFLPEGTPALRRLVLLELIKVDLDYRWSRGQSVRIVDDYLAAFPELAAGGPPCDLLYEEYHVRKRAGDSVQPDDYLKRYPDRADELARLLGLEAPLVSTVLYSGPPAWAVDAGGTIDDFDLLTLLGKGTFGRVFLARQRSMQRLVALKVSADSGDEPQTLAQLDHPHIVRVYDQHLLPDRGLRLLYMQYVAGGTLQGVLETIRQTPEGRRDGRTLLRAVDKAMQKGGESPPAGSARRERLAGLTWPETVCWLGARLAGALDYAHGKGVLHRDVKPANVLLTAEGSPQLADFNVSFSSKLDGANAASFFGGSLAYMSPEQLEAFNPAHAREPGDLDGRSDLYSLCIILWELLAGRRPFRDDGLGDDWGRTLAHMTRQRRNGVDAGERAALPAGRPPGLDQLLLAGLDPDPARRLQSGAAVARELELCLQPRAHELLRPTASGWRSFARRHGFLAVLAAAVAPNILAAVLNLAYNRSEIVARVPGAEPVFQNVEAVINGVAFPVGIIVLGFLAWPATRAARRANAGLPSEPGRLTTARRRCVLLGDYAALVSLVLWLVAGLAYPIGLCAVLGLQSLTFFVHFMVSLALCGLIASVYPFFAVTFFAVRVLLPALIRSAPFGAKELAGLARLKRRTGLYLLLSAVAPMLTVTAWAAMGSENRMALTVLAAVGLAGLGAAFLMSRAILNDLEALIWTVGPRSPGQEGGSSVRIDHG